MTRAKLILAGVAVALVCIGGGAVAAAQNNFRAGPDVSVGPNDTVDSTLFAWGSTIDIAGTVNGDVICAGQSVSISGTVNGDVICAGQSVSISGRVDGSVRVAGQSVTFSGQASRSLSLAGQNVTVQSLGNVARDASVAGQQTAFDGDVARDLYVAGQQIALNGKVGRDADVAGNAITLGSSANIKGSLTYTSDVEVSQEPGAQVGGTITHDLPPAGHDSGVHIGSLIGGSFVFAIFMFVSLLALALVIVLFFPQALNAVTEPAIRQPWKVLLAGLAAGVASPIVIFLLAVTLIGLPLAALGLLVWFLVIALCGPLTGYYLGRLLLGKQADNAFLTMLVGTAVLLILDMLPIVGFIVSFVVLVFGFGMVAMQIYKLPKPQYKLTRTPKAS